MENPERHLRRSRLITNVIFVEGMKLSPRPELQKVPFDKPIPGTEHIRLPDWCDRKQFTIWVRKKTRSGLIPITTLEVTGRHGSLEIKKGLKRAQLFQDILLKSEDKNGFPLT